MPLFINVCLFFIYMIMTATSAPATSTPSATPSALPTIQTWTTSSGVRVLFVPAPDLPMVDVKVIFAAGSAYDGDQPGLASLTANLLVRGAGEWNADQIAERLELIGADLDAGADRDMASVSLRCLTSPEPLRIGLETLTQIINHPQFNDEDLQREQRNRLTALRLEEQSPSKIGSKALYRAIFQQHPYAHSISGTTSSVQTLTSTIVRDFYHRYYVANNALITLIGAIDRQKAQAIAEQIVHDLPAGQAAPTLPEVIMPQQQTAVHIEFPSTQTHLYMGLPGLRRGDPDYFPLYVGNHILGGSGLVSRLMEEIREQRGLSYSVSSYFLPLAQQGPFILNLQTRTSQAEQAKTVLLETVTRFIQDGPTDEELTAAQQNLTGGFPLRIASNSKISQYLAVIGFYKLPLDYLNQFNRQIEGITAEAIRDAFQRRVHLEQLQTITVGKTAEQTVASTPDEAPVSDD
jgi:zinc protease